MADISQFPQPQISPPPAPARAVPECHTYKNALQELAHKASIPIPTYSTVNEGLGHLPSFRATVWVAGKSYTSLNTFLHRKQAEQEAARMAYQDLLEKVKNEQLPPVHEDLVFSKSIMNEYAAKMRLEKPTYQTCQLEGVTPSFKSSLAFNNVNYPSCVGKNKKEAEQLAAREAIQSLLGFAESQAVLAPIIKAKAKLFATMHANNAKPVVETASADGGASMEKDKDALPDDTMVTFVSQRLGFGVSPAEQGSSVVEMNLPISFVPASSEYQFDDTTCSSKKRRKNKKKANKKARAHAMVGSDVDPFNQVAPGSVPLTQ